jgi:hypothetical protein
VLKNLEKGNLFTGVSGSINQALFEVLVDDGKRYKFHAEEVVKQWLQM